MRTYRAKKEKKPAATCKREWALQIYHNNMGDLKRQSVWFQYGACFFTKKENKRMRGQRGTMSKAAFVPWTLLLNAMPFNQRATRENLHSFTSIYNSTLWQVPSTKSWSDWWKTVGFLPLGHRVIDLKSNSDNSVERDSARWLQWIIPATIIEHNALWTQAVVEEWCIIWPTSVTGAWQLKGNSSHLNSASVGESMKMLRMGKQQVLRNIPRFASFQTALFLQYLTNDYKK